MSEVNQRNMARWIVALRSGKYRQTTGKLRSRRTGAMCCLGVACDISGLGKWGAYSEAQRVYVVSEFEQDADTLPPTVANWLFGKRGDTNPMIERERGENDDYSYTEEIQCSEANDDYKMKFREIADALESRYLPNTTAAKVLEGE